MVAINRTAARPLTQRPARARARWISWVIGLAMLAGVVWYAVRNIDGLAFARLVFRADPAWLLLGLLLQLGTYLADARIWHEVLRRARILRPLRSYVGLGLAKLFMDQAIPSGGLSGTLLVVRALDRRGVPRPASMAAVVVDLVSYYVAHVLAVGVALVIIGAHGDLTMLMAVAAGVFAVLAATALTALLFVSRDRRLPRWLQRLPFVSPALRVVGEASPGLAHDRALIARCAGLQLAVLVLDAGTLWAMLWALGITVEPLAVFASFMLATLARILGVVPGGLGVFEAASVATLALMGVPLAAALTATLLFRGFSFWLPMAPGLLLARREGLGT